MKAKSIGVMAQDYETDKVRNIDEIYKSVCTIEGIDDQLIMKLYEASEGVPLKNFKLKIKPSANQYFIFKGNSSSALAYYNPKQEQSAGW